MYFSPPSYLDPGSGSFLIQILIAFFLMCGSPIAFIVGLVAYFRQKKKKPE
jgi:hypothetical protein